MLCININNCVYTLDCFYNSSYLVLTADPWILPRVLLCAITNLIITNLFDIRLLLISLCRTNKHFSWNIQDR